MFDLADFKAVLIYYVVKTVVSDPIGGAKTTAVHLPQLVAANAGVETAFFLYKLHYKTLKDESLHESVNMLVIGLFGHTKQSTQRDNRVFLVVTCVKPIDYLVPAFFKSIP